MSLSAVVAGVIVVGQVSIANNQGGPAPAGDVSAYYIDIGTPPFGVDDYADAMDAVFGEGNWTHATIIDNVPTILADADFIYVEGSDNQAEDLMAWLNLYDDQLIPWVNGGGRLYVNSAPHRGWRLRPALRRHAPVSGVRRRGQRGDRSPDLQRPLHAHHQQLHRRRLLARRVRGRRHARHGERVRAGHARGGQRGRRRSLLRRPRPALDAGAPAGVSEPAAEHPGLRGLRPDDRAGRQRLLRQRRPAALGVGCVRQRDGRGVRRGQLDVRHVRRRCARGHDRRVVHVRRRKRRERR